MMIVNRFYSIPLIGDRTSQQKASVPTMAEKTELTFVEIPCHTSAEINQ